MRVRPVCSSKNATTKHLYPVGNENGSKLETLIEGVKGGDLRQDDKGQIALT